MKYVLVFFIIHSTLISNCNATGLPNFDIPKFAIETYQYMPTVMKYIERVKMVQQHIDELKALTGDLEFVRTVFANFTGIIPNTDVLALNNIVTASDLGLTGENASIYQSKLKNAADFFDQSTAMLRNSKHRVLELNKYKGNPTNTQKEAIVYSSQIDTTESNLLNERIRINAYMAKFEATKKMLERKEAQRRLERTKTDGKIDLSTL